MALVGNLRDFGLSDFLYLVDRGYKTGMLVLQKPGDSARLWFQNGKLVFAVRQGAEERLGDILLRASKITREQRDRALYIQQSVSPEKPVGLILIEQGYITKEEIVRCVRAQLEETVYSLFAWNEGDFRFEPGAMPPPESVTIPLSIENVIMEGVRRIDEWSRIRDRIPTLDVVVRFAEQPSEKAKEVNLTPDEWRVFARINASDNVGQIAQLTSLSEFEVCRIIYGFIQAGLVEVVKERPRGPLPVPTPSRDGQDGRISTTPGANVPRSRESERPTYQQPAPAAHQPLIPVRRNIIQRIIDRITGLLSLLIGLTPANLVGALRLIRSSILYLSGRRIVYAHRQDGNQRGS